MKTLLYVPGEDARALNWTNRHPDYPGRDVMLFRHAAAARGGLLTGEKFRLLRDEKGAYIESTHPSRVRRALGLTADEAGIYGVK